MNIEDEIKKNKETIKAWQKSNFWNEDAEIRELREMVVDVHSMAEMFINFLIAKHLSETTGKKVTGLSKVDAFDVALFDLTKEVDFAKLLKVLQIYKIAPKLVKALYKLNDLRVEFSHMTAKYDKVTGYKDRSKYLEAIKIISDALVELKEVAKESFPDIFKKD